MPGYQWPFTSYSQGKAWAGFGYLVSVQNQLGTWFSTQYCQDQTTVPSYRAQTTPARGQLHFFDELCFNWCVSSGSEGDPTVQTRPSRKAAPTSKLTDANNTERPQLPFQRKAVEAFRSRRAQELAGGTSLANPLIQSIPALPSDNTTLTIPPQPPKHNRSTVMDKDTDGDQNVEDKNIDDQRKPRKSLISTSQTVN